MSRIVEEQRNGAVAWIRLNRPASMNAMNTALASALREAVAATAADPSVHIIVLTGSGRAFCVGADLKALEADLEQEAIGRPDFLDLVLEAVATLRTCDKPVIAALNGITLAGGLEIALCCDIIFSAESARIGDAHANYGVFPGAGGAAILPRRIGLHRAKALLFSGDFLPARTLMEWGLVHQVVPDAELDRTVEEFAQKLATKSSLVLRGMKAIANAALESSETMSLRSELLALRDHMRTADFREGLASFKEKRAPRFEGR